MWLEFSSILQPYRVFSTGDVRKLFPEMSLMNLVRWQKKGYITKIRNGWYCFNDEESTENISWLAANMIYQPSCISLHSALSYYGLIPEAIYDTTSVTSKKTNRFETPVGIYSYHHVRPGIMSFGQTLIEMDAGKPSGRGRKILVATAWKALLDFFYLFPQYNTEKEIELLRFDESVLMETVDQQFFTHLSKYRNKSLESRIMKMIKVYLS